MSTDMDLPFFCQIFQKESLIELVGITWAIVVVVWMTWFPMTVPLY